MKDFQGTKEASTSERTSNSSKHDSFAPEFVSIPVSEYGFA